MVRTEKTEKVISKGTLVHVTAARGDTPMAHRAITKHGNLWLVDHPVHRPDKSAPIWYWCKSLATGWFYDFHVDEMEIAYEADD